MSVDCDSIEHWFSAAPGMMRRSSQVVGVVVEQVELARQTYRLRIECPELAKQILPGQFFMLRSPARDDPLLGRPFALYDTYRSQGQPAGLDLVYHVIGKMTSLMSHWEPGEPVELWGPLGNGFPPPPRGHLLCLGGGIGYTPFLAVAKEALGAACYGDPARQTAHQTNAVTLCYGVRSQTDRADLTDWENLDHLDLRIATDDGTEGHHGLVTDLLQAAIDQTPINTPPGETSSTAATIRRPNVVYCCGPEPMMHAAARLCRAAGLPCWLSLETPMACGFGACFSCVTRVRTDEEPGWDYRRTCVEGPVFPADSLFWETEDLSHSSEESIRQA